LIPSRILSATAIVERNLRGSATSPASRILSATAILEEVKMAREASSLYCQELQGKDTKGTFQMCHFFRRQQSYRSKISTLSSISTATERNTATMINVTFTYNQTIICSDHTKPVYAAFNRVVAIDLLKRLSLKYTSAGRLTMI
jgi:hypothetical protein